MIKVLFICHGNICRSPMAEFVLKDMAVDMDIYVESAATSREEIGNDIYPPAKTKLTEEGISFTHRYARQMTIDDYDRFDYLIGMDEANVRNMNRICGGDPEGKIFRLLSFAGSDRSVADPWYTGNFDATYEDVTLGCRAFLEYLKTNRR